MGRNLSPVLRQELANLEKDADSRKSAMKALKSYVKELDTKAIPLFLAQVSETKDAGSSPGEYTISLYEVLARVHGPNIVSQIDNIMSSIIKTLTTSGGSFPLQQACSKVVPAIARYGIEPTTPEQKKRQIIHSLCKPLSDLLLCSQESLSCGAALCLKALVDCDNWRFADDGLVNEVCLKLAGALEDQSTQTNSHMGLVMSLAKRNSLVVEAYARLLIHAGLRILNCGQAERNSQKRLTAIQMVHSLMKCLDIRSIFQELDFIIEEMEKCQSDQMPYVKGAAFEALQTAKRLLVEKGSKIDSSDVVSVTGSNFGRSGNGRRRRISSPENVSLLSGSPESQTLDSFAEYGSFMESPISTTQGSCNVNQTRKNVNRKLWNHENGCVDISLKDGLFSELARESSRSSHASSEQDGGPEMRRGYANGFPGFISGSSANGALRSRTPSPQRTGSQINVDNVRIFTTPRKLVRSLQDDDESSDYPENQTRRHRSLCSGKCQWSPVAKYIENGHLKNGRPRNGFGDTTDSESVLSTEDIAANTNGEVHNEAFLAVECKYQKQVKMSNKKIANLFLFIILAVFATVIWFGGQDESLNLVPT